MTSSAPRSDFSTPNSERSVYFDAPIMHIFSKDEQHDGDGFVAPAAPVPVKPRTSLMYDYSGPQVRPRGSLLGAGMGAGDTGMRATDYAAQGGARQPANDAPADQSDSGYSSSSPRNIPRAMPNATMDANADRFQPVPVVWNGAPGQGGQEHYGEEDDRGTPQPQPQTWRRTQELAGGPPQRMGMGEPRRSQSMRSFRQSTIGDRDRDAYGTGNVNDTSSASMRTTASGRLRRRMSLNNGSFANGAGTVGPAAVPTNEETSVFRSRSINADAGLSKKQRSRIGKIELKEGKRLVKVMKEEAKAEKKALEVTVKELAEIQRMQKSSIKEEAKTNASYAQALRVFHKEELEYMAARAKYERAQADLQAYEDAREAARDHAREATEMLQEKNREVELLRAQKAADDREREAKIRQLSGKT